MLWTLKRMDVLKYMTSIIFGGGSDQLHPQWMIWERVVSIALAIVCIYFMYCARTSTSKPSPCFSPVQSAGIARGELLHAMFAERLDACKQNAMHVNTIIKHSRPQCLHLAEYTAWITCTCCRGQFPLYRSLAWPAWLAESTNSLQHHVLSDWTVEKFGFFYFHFIIGFLIM